jgi:Raf kinase inhibitor-like YbhB/YbcL family protein
MIQPPTYISQDIKTMEVKSKAFANQTYIPIKYTCDGANVNPPLVVKNIPHKTKSLVLIIDDPDAPVGTWTHWIVWNVVPSGKIRENSIPGNEGVNSFKQQNYGGPCPPSGIHHYIFKIYALDELLQLPITSTKNEVEKAMSAHIIGYGELVGLYKRVL